MFTSQGKTPRSIDLILCQESKLTDRSPSKPSRPSRAYLHLTAESHLQSLAEAVRRSTFEDSQNTFTSPALVGPPNVEFAPYGRVPGGRRRTDARAGTIDQDPEFMAFLEGLANPSTVKEVNLDAVPDEAANKPEKVTTTPLVQYLKDKKANKTKEAALKAAKKQESQIAKQKPAKENTAPAEDSKKKGKETKTDRVVEKAAKEAVKILNREASIKIASSKSSSEASSSEPAATPKLDVTKVPGRQRPAMVAAHIRMLQRDLGFSPAQAHRQVRRDTADAQKAQRAAGDKVTTELQDTSSQSPPSQAIPIAPKASSNAANSRRSRGKGSADSDTGKATASSSGNAGPSQPVILLKKPDASQSSAAQPALQSPKPAPTAPAAAARKHPLVAVPSEGATQAFVKHANPSQGITEPLLKEAMENFGAVSMVEIDKRKGFAYVDFIEPAGLKKAMAANPIPVAQGTVQVMQRKGTAQPPEKKPTHQPPHAPASRGGRGGRGGAIGRRGGRGGGRGNHQSSSSEPALASSSAPADTAAK